VFNTRYAKVIVHLHTIFNDKTQQAVYLRDIFRFLRGSILLPAIIKQSRFFRFRLFDNVTALPSAVKFLVKLLPATMQIICVEVDIYVTIAATKSNGDFLCCDYSAS